MLLGDLRDLFCLLPSWPSRHVLELAPAYCEATLANAEETQRLLAADVYRQPCLGVSSPRQIAL